MKKNKVSEEMKKVDTVLMYQTQVLEELKNKTHDKSVAAIESSEELLRKLGYDPGKMKGIPVEKEESKKIINVLDIDSLYKKATETVGENCTIEDLFTADELAENSAIIKAMNKEYNQIHRLDEIDIAIIAMASIIGAATDIFLVGIPQKTYDGLKAAPLSDYIRNYFDKLLPEEEMKKLANSKASKVPYDAQDNRNTVIRVEGLSAIYHRYHQLGHDPLLGFIFGVYDILNGKMTAVDKDGNFISQVMENYTERKEETLFAALSKQVAHLKSDVTTSMGLPAPLMGLCNFLQFGSIGEEEQTIAEIARGMYYEGYDFIHFCSMSVPVMLVEVIVRLGYALKRKKEGYKGKDIIPFSMDREKHPKLETMLFVAHAGATAANAGKIYFTRNPVAINYPQWVDFAKYTYKQAKWMLIDKPKKKDKYVREEIGKGWDQLVQMIDSHLEELSEDYIFVFE